MNAIFILIECSVYFKILSVKHQYNFQVVVQPRPFASPKQSSCFTVSTIIFRMCMFRSSHIRAGCEQAYYTK